MLWPEPVRAVFGLGRGRRKLCRGAWSTGRTMSTTAAMSYDFNLDGGGVRLDGDELVVSGYASNFDVDRVGDTVTRQALERALSKYMHNPVMLYNHSYTQPA